MDIYNPNAHMIYADTTAIRKRFRDYRATIVRLKDIIRDLQSDASDEEYAREEAVSRAHRQAEQARRDAEYAREEAQRKAYQMEDDIRSATKELKRAQDWNDDYAAERALRKLKNIGG